MKNTNMNEEYEQSTLDFGDSLNVIENLKEDSKTKEEKSTTKEFEVGDKIAVKQETTHFCDGRGIPDYARTAYIKRIIPAHKTVLIESTPNGKELGLLFISDIILA